MSISNLYLLWHYDNELGKEDSRNPEKDEEVTYMSISSSVTGNNDTFHTFNIYDPPPPHHHHHHKNNHITKKTWFLSCIAVMAFLCVGLGLLLVLLSSITCHSSLSSSTPFFTSSSFNKCDLPPTVDSNLGVEVEGTSPTTKHFGTGPYKLLEIHAGTNFFQNYVFYNAKDSLGSNAYVNYLDEISAMDQSKIVNVTYEPEVGQDDKDEENYEPFVYMTTKPTNQGPRDSVRIESVKRYNRGLFVLDLRHMPAGCGTWPAFWLTDRLNWPTNGEIDILEGVNRQTVAKTALHTTKGCSMYDTPLGRYTGIWDIAQGVPFINGTIDTTVRYARDCFVYSPRQWLNQGCVGVESVEGTIGTPLNEKGGGVVVLEWDPISGHIKSWVFSPHSTVPENLKQSMDAANQYHRDKEGGGGENNHRESTKTKTKTNNSFTSSFSNPVRPDPTSWGLPYAYFPIGKGTTCASDHFKHMHLIFNTALCGSVAGNRFSMDCPILQETYGSCENYIKADTDAMEELYWKIRGVYIYEREWG